MKKAAERLCKLLGLTLADGLSLLPFLFLAVSVALFISGMTLFLASKL